MLAFRDVLENKILEKLLFLDFQKPRGIEGKNANSVFPQHSLILGPMSSLVATCQVLTRLVATCRYPWPDCRTRGHIYNHVQGYISGLVATCQDTWRHSSGFVATLKIMLRSHLKSYSSHIQNKIKAHIYAAFKICSRLHLKSHLKPACQMRFEATCKITSK